MVVVGSFFVVSGGIHLRAKVAEQSDQEHALSFLWGGAGKSDRNDWRIDAAHSALDHDEPRSNRTHAHRILYLSCEQYWWSAFAGGSAVVPRISERRTVLVDLPTLLAPMAGGGRIGSPGIFRSRSHQSSDGEKSGESDLTKWGCEGAHNFIFLFVLLGALIAVPAGWREPLMVLTALGSYLATPKRIRAANNFTFGPLKEVGWLFLGIFGTMIPVLEYMERSAGKLGLNSDLAFYWGDRPAVGCA